MSSIRAPGTIDDLAAFVVEQAGRPIDVWAVAALLESGGVRDLDAVERHARRDVFALAEAVHARLPEIPPEPLPAPPPRGSRRERARRFARLYGRGSFFVVPLGLQLVALLTFGISQYASVDFTIREASIVALAVLAAFVSTAGLVQVTGFLGPVFEVPGKHMLNERVMRRLMAGGLGMVLLVGGLLWALAAAAGYEATETRIGLGYFALVGAQGLTQAQLYVRKRYGAMIATTLVGTATVVALHEATDLPLYAQHWISLGLALAIELAIVAVLLRRAARETRGSLRLAKVARPSLLARRAAPFAAYGTVYFLFVSTDRLAAWADGRHPLPLWFRPEYELGLALALGGVVLALAFLEFTVETFSDMIMPVSERYRLSARDEHNRFLLGFWRRQLAAVGALVAIGACVAVGAAVALDRLDALGPAAGAFDSPASRWAFAGGIVGYALLALGLANGIFVLSLGRTWIVAQALAPAVVLSVAVSIVATTVGPYYAAVAGPVAGGLLFATLTGVAARRTLRRADYWSYAAW